jgi:hypothetical protein
MPCANHRTWPIISTTETVTGEPANSRAKANPHSQVTKTATAPRMWLEPRSSELVRAAGGTEELERGVEASP